MKRLINILNHRWAIFIAFVPIVNLLYLIFRFLLRVDNSCKIPIWLIGIVGAPLCVLYPIMPDSFDWLITHLILSVITALVIYKSRGGYYPQLRLSKDALSFLVVGGIVGLVLICNAPRLSMVNQVSRYTEEALYAIINDDETAWQVFLHPEYGLSLQNFDAYKEYLETQGIVICKDFNVSKHISAYQDGDTGKTVTQDTYIISSGKKYRVDVTYLENASGSGFTEFKILKSDN